MKLPDTPLWMGSQASYDNVLAAYAYYLDNPSVAAEARKYHEQETRANNPFMNDDDDYEPFYDLIQTFDGTGIINIVGDLVDEESWVNQMFGMTAYSSIMKAVDFFLEDADIEDIVLNFDTNGGTVSGLEPAGRMIKSADSIKPVRAHVNGSAFSAGYWLASSARSINATNLSEVGNIGVLMVHKDMSKALEQRGIDVTLIKAGKYKGLGHPSKPLSEEDRSILEGKAQTIYSFFLEKIAADRPLLTLASKDVWAEGLMFFAGDAISVGLIDTIKATDEYFNALAVDKNTARANNRGVTTPNTLENVMPKSVILKSQQDKAALMSGASLDELDHQELAEAKIAEIAATASAAATAEGGDEAAIKTAVTKAITTYVTDNGGDEALAVSSVAGYFASLDEGEGTEEEEQAPSAAEVAATAAAAAAATALESLPAGSHLDTLLGKVTKLTEENTQLKITAAASVTKEAEMDTSLASLKEIAIVAIHRMQIALKSDPSDLEELPVSTIVAKYQKVLATFEGEFIVGQKTRSSTTDNDDAPSALSLGIVPKS